jgi:protein phosphatase
VGKRRERNEDSFLINDDLRLAVVADGMGGHLGGEFASKMAVTTVEEVIQAIESDPEITLQEGTKIRQGDYSGYLRYATQIASTRIFEKATNDATLRGMGTTTVAALFRQNKVYIANVGDSRAYRVRDGKIQQITKDHSLVGEQIRAGILSEDDARAHKLKNIITRSVGFQEEVDTDIDIRIVREGDKFIMCSDGLSNMVGDDELCTIVEDNDLETACKHLVDVANERGGDDNITVVIAQVESLSEDADKALDSEEDETLEI